MDTTTRSAKATSKPRACPAAPARHPDVRSTRSRIGAAPTTCDAHVPRPSRQTTTSGLTKRTSTARARSSPTSSWRTTEDIAPRTRASRASRPWHVERAGPVRSPPVTPRSRAQPLSLSGANVASMALGSARCRRAARSHVLLERRPSGRWRLPLRRGRRLERLLRRPERQPQGPRHCRHQVRR